MYLFVIISTSSFSNPGNSALSRNWFPSSTKSTRATLVGHFWAVVGNQALIGKNGDIRSSKDFLKSSNIESKPWERVVSRCGRIVIWFSFSGVSTVSFFLVFLSIFQNLLYTTLGSIPKILKYKFFSIVVGTYG